MTPVATAPRRDAGRSAEGFAAMSEHYFTELNERLHRLEEQRPMFSDLKNRIARLERSIDQIHNLEISLARVKEIEAERSAAHDDQIRVPPQIGEIVKNLDQPLEGIRRTFSCTRCGTRNRVAVHIKCTACETNSWLGWWPERRPRGPAGPRTGAHAASRHPRAEIERALRADL